MTAILANTGSFACSQSILTLSQSFQKKVTLSVYFLLGVIQSVLIFFKCLNPFSPGFASVKKEEEKKKKKDITYFLQTFLFK